MARTERPSEAQTEAMLERAVALHAEATARHAKAEGNHKLGALIDRSFADGVLSAIQWQNGHTDNDPIEQEDGT